MVTWALGTPCKVQARSPHSGNRQARLILATTFTARLAIAACRHASSAVRHLSSVLCKLSTSISMGQGVVGFGVGHWSCFMTTTSMQQSLPHRLHIRYPIQLAGACTPLRAWVPKVQKCAHACPPPAELRVVQPPIHPRVRPAENGGKFFVLCFQPVTFPCALCAQVTRASARETMATAHSGSARDRHW